MANRFYLDQWVLRALDYEALSSLGGNEVYNWLLMSSIDILGKVIETSMNLPSLNFWGLRICDLQETNHFHFSRIWPRRVRLFIFFNFRKKIHAFSFPYPVFRVFLFWSEKRIANSMIPIPSNVFWYITLCFVKIHKDKTWPPSFRAFLSKWFSSSVKDDCFLNFE